MDENVAKEEVVNTVPDCNVMEEEVSFEARAQTEKPEHHREGGEVDEETSYLSAKADEKKIHENGLRLMK